MFTWEINCNNKIIFNVMLYRSPGDLLDELPGSFGSIINALNKDDP